MGLSLVFLALILVLAKATEQTIGDTTIPFLSYLLIFLVFISGIIITYTNKEDNL